MLRHNTFNLSKIVANNVFNLTGAIYYRKHCAIGYEFMFPKIRKTRILNLVTMWVAETQKGSIKKSHNQYHYYFKFSVYNIVEEIKMLLGF